MLKGGGTILWVFFTLYERVLWGSSVGNASEVLSPATKSSSKYFWNVYVIPRKSSGLICSWEVEAKKDLCAKLDPFAAVKLHDLEVQAMNLMNCRDNEGTVIMCSSFD